jgi:2-keto-3-deoxy-L-rhamnonate aldolase RhmA
MSITQGQVAVGTAVAQLNSPQSMPGIVHITNRDNTDTVFVGGAAVTTSTGHGILKSDSIDIQIFAEQVLYAISTKGSHNVSWLHVTP